MRPGQQWPRKLSRSFPAGGMVLTASMRPGQQWPRKLPAPRRPHEGLTDASMRPGQQWPRKPSGGGSRGGPARCFNEAGATMAPETFPLTAIDVHDVLASMRPGQQWPRKLPRSEVVWYSVPSASMRPGQQWPRKQPGLHLEGGLVGRASMRPGQQWPRKLSPSISVHRLDYFPGLRAPSSIASDHQDFSLQCSSRSPVTS